MTFKIFFGLLIIIVRLLLAVKVISWIILNLIGDAQHPIDEIQTYLVLMFLDIWVSSQPTEIIIRNNQD